MTGFGLGRPVKPQTSTSVALEHEFRLGATRGGSLTYRLHAKVTQGDI